MDKNEVELKPCPFCRNKTEYNDGLVNHVPPNVYCHTCMFYIGKWTKEEAIKAWNRRPSQKWNWPEKQELNSKWQSHTKFRENGGWNACVEECKRLNNNNAEN